VAKCGGLENASSSVVLRVLNDLQSVVVGVRGVLRAPSAASMQLSVEQPVARFRFYLTRSTRMVSSSSSPFIRHPELV